MGQKKPSKKPTNAPPVTDLAAARETDDGDTPAEPEIASPVRGNVAAGRDLEVKIFTNRTDLNYTVTLTDLTPPAAAPVVISVAPPGTSPFLVTIPAANIVVGHQYQIVVAVNPPAGHGIATVTVTAV